MSFEVAADAYARYMGRYADPLAPQLADLAAVVVGQRVLDVGCGPGALTSVLVDRLGEAHVSGIDPSSSFVAATRQRFPGVDVREGVAEALPWPDASFDAALAQLVVHFMADPAAGLREMARVTSSGGIVAACVWDHSRGRGPLSPFWRAASSVLPAARGEGHLPGASAGHLARLLTEAGLTDVSETELDVTVRYASFEDWWEPYLLGVGPAGDFVAGLDAEARDQVRSACRDLLGEGPFEVEAVAWAAVGRVSR